MIKKILITVSILATGYSILFCQSEQLVINLENPALPGRLILENPRGSIKVTGYEGEVIVVSAGLRFGDNLKSTGDGLKKIEQNTLDLSASVNGANVDLQCKTSGKTVDLDIKVPLSFSLKLRSLDNGKIEITNVKGEIEVENTNGDISLQNVSGSAVLSSVYGKITASFREVTPNAPMMFTSFEGDISVTLPQTINARMKMKSEKGQILSDFEMKPAKRQPVINKIDSTRIYSLEDWANYDVNKGGPEYIIRTYNGNVILRKR
jgi:hypothetical protein